jgi:hypothetical protein
MEILWKCQILENVVPSLAYMQKIVKNIIVYYELKILLFFSLSFWFMMQCDVLFKLHMGHDTY